MASSTMPASSLSPPLDLSHQWSRTTRNRGFDVFKAFYKYFQIPGIGNLAGGLPNDKYFPFDTLEARVARPERWPSSRPDQGHEQSKEQSILARLAAARVSDTPGPYHITVPREAPASDPTRRIDLSTALQYGTAEGYPPLRSFLRQFARDHLHHDVPYLGGPEIVVTCGSTDGFFKIAELLVDPWSPDVNPVCERPGMLCEAFVYMVPASTVEPRGVQIVPVEIDSVGMLAKGPGSLEDVLENWDPTKGRRPHFMYTVTMGQNPTGSILTVERRRELYDICCKYDVIIVEDDPYWNLQYPSAGAEEARSRGLPVPEETETFASGKSSGYEFLDSLVPSYLRIDTEGRVIRLDTCSKVIAPGCRLGWITAQPAFIERLNRITEVSTQQPSGFVQAMVAELIMGSQPEAMSAFRALTTPGDRASFSGWSMDGWVRWCEGLRGNYERRMRKMCTILDQHSYQLKQSTPVQDTEADWGVITKTRLMSFHWPKAGMFVWARIYFESHPLWQARGRRLPVLDGPALGVALTMFCTHEPHRVIPAPGGMFATTDAIRVERSWAYVRLCFAAVAEEEIEPCTSRFANALQKFWRVKSVEAMEKYIGEMEVASTAHTAEGLVNLGYMVGC